MWSAGRETRTPLEAGPDLTFCSFPSRQLLGLEINFHCGNFDLICRYLHFSSIILYKIGFEFTKIIYSDLMDNSESIRLFGRRRS